MALAPAASTPRAQATTPALAGLKGKATPGLGKATPGKPLAAVFNAESSDEEEEIPSEARMRMKNIGRQTITSSGPNSFGKTKGGFTDHNAMLERQLKAAMDEVSNDNVCASEYGS